jgi:hypothetical protein
MSDLAAFQDRFAGALTNEARGLDARIAWLAAQPGFAVYRNTVRKACIDALEANFPAVARLVGDEWFRAAAAVYVQRELPAHPTLLDYGAGFPAFIAGFAPARELPYLAEVAQLDRWWSESHVAADDQRLKPAALAALDPEALATVSLRPHAAARWGWFPSQPIATIWWRNRFALNEIESDLDWRGEGAILTRPGEDVRFTPGQRADIVFLDACARGGSMALAAEATLAIDSRFDFARATEIWLAAGVFAEVRAAAPQEEAK